MTPRGVVSLPHLYARCVSLDLKMTATPWVINLWPPGSDGAIKRNRRKIGRPATSTSPKQIRARARRQQLAAAEAFDMLAKPIEEWDAEELARGRQRDKSGGWRGKGSPYMDRALHERIIAQFQKVVKGEIAQHTVLALKVMQTILEDESLDGKGKPRVSAQAKLDAAKFCIEHIIGKPTQHTETDISVKLQGILGMAMVNPTTNGQFAPTQAYIEVGPGHYRDEAELDVDNE